MTSSPKRLTLLAAILGSSVVFLDGTVVNVALPAIREDLDTGLAEQQWIVEAYLLTLGSLISSAARWATCWAAGACSCGAWSASASPRRCARSRRARCR
ncbi:MAG TPA: hypothetical protein VH741_05100 [Candidatus Limnocylindrales bacterium]